ncbi:MAG: exodeoxyribonuclease V subunit alpha [Desulfomonilia bacterium]|jgi:exodeoxyribonuclease V alpha subunit
MESLNAYRTAAEDIPGRKVEPAGFAPIDLHFAWLMERLSGTGESPVFAAAALVSRETRQGHVCIDLASYAGLTFRDERSGMILKCPSLEQWVEALVSSEVVGSPGEYRPLILDRGSRLYLWRYWNRERSLADRLLELARKEMPLDAAGIAERLAQHFGAHQDPGGIDWQKVAVLMGLKGALCIITGGPGTGKTTVVTRILALLTGLDPEIRIALAAPTGKAAQRLEESLERTLESLKDRGITAPGAQGLRASTIHRLLGIVPGRPGSGRSQDNPLPHDVVVVDEASMASLDLMHRLILALKPDARLILVGDRDQLASVEPGHVLGDICGSAPGRCYSLRTCSLVRQAAGYELPQGAVSPVDDCLVELKHIYRFSGNSSIKRLSEAVRIGDRGACVDMLRSGGFDDIEAREVSTPGQVRELLEETVVPGYSPCLEADQAGERFALFSGFRVLCALREGPFGVVAVNRAIEEILSERGLIRPRGRHYHGRPILVTANDYGIRLFNGDIGFILIDREDGELRAFFPAPGGGVRRISLARLPEHETAFAMTVHKSQGSEFSRVALLLPPKDSPVLTRELVYTGITRAGRFLHLWATPEILGTAIRRRTQRASGLGDLLRPGQ